jgi:hypothetical protein
MKTLFDESLAGYGHQNEKSFEAGSIRRSPYRMANRQFSYTLPNTSIEGDGGCNPPPRTALFLES